MTAAWLEHRRARFMRPDAWRYLKPGTPGYDPPPGIGYQEPAYWREALIEAKAAQSQAEDDERAFQRELASIRLELALFKLAEKAHQAAFRSDMARWRAANARGFQRVRAMLTAKDGLKSDLKAGFRPDQPRDDHGRWSDQGGQGEVSGDSSSTSLSASSNKNRPRGHHTVPRQLFDNLPFPPETRKVFEEATSGRIRLRIVREDGLISGHFWDGPNGAHARYNRAVRESLDHFMSARGIAAQDMTPARARSFLADIERSQDPRIRDYRSAIRLLRRIFGLRSGSRGTQ